MFMQESDVRLPQRKMREISILVAGAGSRTFLGRWLGQHVDKAPWLSRSIAQVAGKGYLVIAKNDHEDAVTIELYADLHAVIDSDIPADLKRAATNQTIEDEAPDLAERMRNGALTIGEAVRELFRRTSDDAR